MHITEINSRRQFLISASTLIVLLLAFPLHAQAPPDPIFPAPAGGSDAMPPSSPWSPPATPKIASASSAPTLPAPILPAPDKDIDDRESTEEAAGPLVDEDVAGAASYWYEPLDWLRPPPWDTGIELGLNGSTGTNEALSIRTGGYAKRTSGSFKFDFSLYHNRTTTSGLTTQNNATMDVRSDWSLADDSRWTLFAKTNLFYDQFQTFDLQTNANSGVGYELLKLRDLNVTGRVGGGASREFGGPDDQWVPEALFGVDYEQEFADTHKIFYKFEYFPEFDEFGQYRMVTDAGWEISLAKPSNVSLKLSATDRYDSTPNGADPHLVNYSVLLLLKL